MSRHTFYAYVDGSDLHDLEETLFSRLNAFVGSRDWVCSNVVIVNQHGDPNDPSLGPDDLPDWDLGLNFALPDPGAERAGWFTDIESTAQFLGQLHADTGREFIIGIGDSERGISEDLFFVDSPTPDLSALRKIIGVGEVA